MDMEPEDSYDSDLEEIEALQELPPVKMIYRALQPGMRAHGFVPSKWAFERRINDVIWYYSIGLPEPLDDGHLGFAPEVSVLSPPLLKKTLDDLADIEEEGVAQVRARLNVLDSSDELVLLRPEDDLPTLVGRLLRDFEAVGLPFLQGHRSTHDVVRTLQSYTYCTRGRERCTWEADVWEGRVDPVLQPCESSINSPDNEFTSVEEAIKWIKENLNE